jgi:GTP-binding nuclear protein Ran
MSFSICLLGSQSVGKSTLINRQATGSFSNDECSNTLLFNTTKGLVTLNITETRKDLGYYDAYILMFSLKSKATYHHAIDLYNSISEMKHKPTVMCGTHCDLSDNEMTSKDITFHREVDRPNKMYAFEISSKSNYNYEKSFLYLMRELLHDETLEFANIEM